MNRFLQLLKKAHTDEQGAEGLEKILIIAAVVLPLLGLLIYFRDWIKDWALDETDKVQGDNTNAGDLHDPGFNDF